MDTWVQNSIDLMDALDIEKTHLVGNSFGAALSVALTLRHPDRVDKLVLMGGVGTGFELTDGLDAVWGYEPSIENMKKLLDIFAFNRALVTDELAELRYQASIQPGFQEAFSSMFPAPRQQWVDSMAASEAEVKTIEQETLIIHGREDRVIPLPASFKMAELIPRSQLHVFGQCGHWTQIEHKDRFNTLLMNFFSE
jgi:2-hydroxymuconate-semialdehyde hydrolase